MAVITHDICFLYYFLRKSKLPEIIIDNLIFFFYNNYGEVYDSIFNIDSYGA